MRDTVYFNGHGTAIPLLVITGWTAVGVPITVAATAGYARRAAHQLDAASRLARTGEQEHLSPHPHPVTG